MPKRLGNAHPSIVPYQDFPTADGHMIIAVGNDSQFASLCAAFGSPEWAMDARFATNPERVRYRDELVTLIGAATRTQTTDEWLRRMEEAKVPCGPINTLDRVFDDPQVRARGLRIEMPHPAASAVPLVANPIRLSESPVTYRLAPPTLGQHTDEVLRDWLGLDAETLAELRRKQVL